MDRRLLAGLLLAAGCRHKDAATQQTAAPPPELAEIAIAEDARDVGAARLLQLSAAPSPMVRRRALLALGRIGAPAFAATARDRLSDGDAPTRAAAAFALELISDEEAARPAESEARLIARLAVEPDRDARRRALRALGRLGGDPGEAALRGALTATDGDAATRAEAARAILVYGARGKIATAETHAAMQQALTAPSDELRLAAAQALYRLKPTAADLPALTFALRDGDPVVRAAAARALGGSAAPPQPPLVAALSDGDWRVRVEAARVLAPLDRAAVLPLADPGSLAGDGGDRLVVALAAIDALAPAAAKFPPAAAPTDPPATSRVAAFYRCSADGLRVRAGVDDDLLSSCAPDELVPAWRKQVMRAAALGDRPAGDGNRLPRLLALAAAADGRVRAAAIDALAPIDDPRAAAAIRIAISDGDAGALNAACEAAARAAKDRRADAGAAAAIAARVATADDVAQVEPLLSCIDALRTLGDKSDPVLASLRARLADANLSVRAHTREALTWLTGAAPAEAVGAIPSPAPGDVAALAGKKVTATFVTARGAFTLELFPDETPRTVAAVVALARRGFYDRLTFHRVAADFVVQGGDPRGDGYGGPGFTLRDEPTPRRFTRGTAGIALAGKDTGGSQIFVCQSDSPHLEGKFTAFGRIVSGMETIDRMVADEPITGVRVDVQ